MNVYLLPFILQIYSLKIDNPNDCAKKFLSNNTVGLIFFLGIVLGTLLQDSNSKKTETSEILRKITPSQQIVQMQPK